MPGPNRWAGPDEAPPGAFFRSEARDRELTAPLPLYRASEREREGPAAKRWEGEGAILCDRWITSMTSSCAVRGHRVLRSPSPQPSPASKRGRGSSCALRLGRSVGGNWSPLHFGLRPRDAISRSRVFWQCSRLKALTRSASPSLNASRIRRCSVWAISSPSLLLWSNQT
jgi:hypothetical protein